MSELQTKQEKPTAILSRALTSKDSDLRSILPSTISPEQFRTIVMTAVAGDADLMLVAGTQEGRQSIILSAVSCARDGLIPDKKEAAFVVFNTQNKKTKTWNKLAQYMPMVRGLQKTMRNSGEVTKISTAVVYDKDHFEHRMGDEESLVHLPAPLDAERGTVIGAYAIISLKNGEKIREVLRLEDINKIKGASKTSKFGPWVDWFDEMARKSALRRAYKSAPSSADVDQIIESDNAQYKTEGLVDFSQHQLTPAIEKPKKPEPKLVDMSAEEIPSFDEPTELAWSFTDWNGEVIECGTEDELEQAVIKAIQDAPDRQTGYAMLENLKSPDTFGAYEQAWPQDEEATA